MNEHKNLAAATDVAAQPGQDPAATAERVDEGRAALPDDTTVPADIAALYLRMSPAELADAEKQKKRTDGRVDKSAKGQSLPAVYKLGALRELAKKQPAPSGADAVSKAGMLGWVTIKLPFFAELEPRVKRGRRVLIGSVWDAAPAEREALFADLLEGRIRFTWLTSSEAAASLWSDLASHRAFAAKGLALLQGEVRAIEASIGATELLGAGSSAAGAKAET